jgi:hypothetical protein
MEEEVGGGGAEGVDPVAATDWPAGAGTGAGPALGPSTAPGGGGTDVAAAGSARSGAAADDAGRAPVGPGGDANGPAWAFTARAMRGRPLGDGAAASGGGKGPGPPTLEGGPPVARVCTQRATAGGMRLNACGVDGSGEGGGAAGEGGKEVGMRAPACSRVLRRRGRRRCPQQPSTMHRMCVSTSARRGSPKKLAPRHPTGGAPGSARPAPAPPSPSADGHGTSSTPACRRCLTVPTPQGSPRARRDGRQARAHGRRRAAGWRRDESDGGGGGGGAGRRARGGE